MQPAANFGASLTDDGRYRLLVEAVTDYAIYMLDGGGYVSSWNPGAQRFKGYTADEIIGQHFSRFYTDEDRQAGLPVRALATAAREGKFEDEGWRLRKDGTRFWAHVVIDPIRLPKGEVIGYAKITRDLTERRLAEDSLKRSEEQFRLLVQGVTDYAIYMLDTDGRVSSWNAGAERIKGYTEEEVVGLHFSHFYRPEDRAQQLPELALEAATREGRYESEGWRVRKDGSQFWANVVVDAIHDETGRLIGYAKVTRDVSAKRETQRALEVARESLFQAQKLDAIGQLTGGVAHDFNNLLTVIVSNLTIVLRRMDDEPKLKNLLEGAVKAAHRGASLTQRMLAFARRQDLSPVPVNVADSVRGMSDLMARSLGPSVVISFAFPEQLKPVLVDPNQLELALLNLVVNARDAMPKGGEIVVAAEEVSASGEAANLAAHTFVRLRVTDAGEGMDEATLARATEPFFTTKGVGKGTGLGLSMVQGLAKQSGGQFLLKSEPGRGTTAELWLPAAAAAPAPAEVVTSLVAGQAITSQPLVVLAVDDDNLVLASTIAMLEDLGHAARGASSAPEALDLLATMGDVQLLLTDQAMPGMTGAELIQQVRTRWPALPIVLSTGFAELKEPLPSVVMKLAKPYVQAELERAIAEAVKYLA